MGKQCRPRSDSSKANSAESDKASQKANSVTPDQAAQRLNRVDQEKAAQSKTGGQNVQTQNRQLKWHTV